VRGNAVLMHLSCTTIVNFLHGCAPSPTRAKKKTLVAELIHLLVLILQKNGNGGYKTQHRFLGMLYGLLNNQRAVSSFASPASRGA